MSNKINVGVINESGRPVVFIQIGPVVQHLEPEESVSLAEALAVSATFAEMAQAMAGLDPMKPTPTDEDRLLNVDISKMN